MDNGTTHDLTVRNRHILGIAAHADDLDFGCAGSIAVWTAQGATVDYFILTDGSKGSEHLEISGSQLIRLREEEQRRAAAILGVSDVRFAGFTDGELANTAEVRYQIVKRIREAKPDIVLTTDPTFIYSAEFGFVNHPDHRAAGQAVLDSVFPFARNSRTFPDLLEAGLKPHTVPEILLSNFVAGTYIVDVSQVYDRKLAALREHKSQYDDFNRLRTMIEKRSGEIGKRIGVKFAESFVRITVS
jgi:LmbE family N-acetylglucosaminyl deacetylase